MQWFVLCVNLHFSIGLIIVDIKPPHHIVFEQFRCSQVSKGRSRPADCYEYTLLLSVLVPSSSLSMICILLLIPPKVIHCILIYSLQDKQLTWKSALC